MQRRHFLQAGLAGAGALAGIAPALAGIAPALAAAYPSRPVRLVVAVAPGGSADKLARTLAQRLSEDWGQRIIVENVPGASSAIGYGHVAKASPDGYTLLLASDTLSIQAVQKSKSLPYDPLRDFAGITKAVSSPQLLLVRPGLGVRNFAQYVALLKSRPGQVSLGLPSGIGSVQHLAVEMLSQRTGTQTNNIPFPGGGPVMIDMLGGHIDATLITLAAATEHVRAGKLVPIAVTTAQRSKALPDVPTLQEAGVAGYVIDSWQGIAAPAGTPPEIVGKLHRDFIGVLRRPDIAKGLEEQGFEILGGSPQDLQRTVLNDARLYARIAADAALTL